MVLRNEEKVDVFADFHLDRPVGDNEDRLNRQEEDEIRHTSHLFNDNVFSQFQLDEIIREHEDRLRREDKEKGSAAAAAAEDEIGSRISSGNNGKRTSTWSEMFPPIPRPRILSLQRAVSADTGVKEAVCKQDNGIRWKSERADPASPSIRGLFQRKLLRASMIDRGRSGCSSQSNEDDYGDRDCVELGDDGESTAATSKRPLWRKSQKLTNSSRCGTTVTAPATIPEAEEYYDSSEEGFCSGNDVEEGENDTYDDYNRGNISPGKKRNAITISSTGMPVGGMIATKKDSQYSDYRWVSPHVSDEIFSDFDIDAIAKDYDKLARQMNFANLDCDSVDELDDVDEEGNEHIIGIKVRYQNLLELWVDNFPRTHVITVRIIMPMIVIILATVYLGKILALLEWGAEIEDNDSIMRSRHQMVDPFNEELPILSALPTLCFDYYRQQKFRKYELSDNSVPTDISTIIESQGSFESFDDSFVGDETSISATMSKFANLSFPLIESEIDPDPKVIISEIGSFMKVCRDLVNEITMKAAKEVHEDKLASQEELTFHWMRCWNETDLGNVNPFIPTKDQLAASWHQGEFYEENWKKNQTGLYEEYKIKYNCSPEDSPRTQCHMNAYQKSVEEATGSAMCSTNTAASAWFWFVFMTTVGYGNVSPETANGRIMVGVLGIFTIPMWAILLYIAGKVLGIVIDDLFRRWNCRFMTKNLPSVFVWALISLFWIFIIAEFFLLTQNFADDPEEYRFSPFGLRDEDTARENKIQINDAYWFSYISVLTVGLGDFSLPPEPFFLQDLYIWSLVFLLGFTFISTFLGQVADLTHSMFPDSGNDLKERLLNTNVVGRKEVQYKKENEKGIEKLEKLVEVMDDDDMELLTQRVTRIRVKKNLLIHLLHQTETELEYYKKQGERYENLSYARVCEEENMLNEVFRHTTKEREKLQSYQRSAVDPESSLPSDKQKFFADGTSQDLVAEKLKLRQEKNAKGNLLASWYI